MTSERLNELADWLTQSSAEELLDDIDNVAAISEFLRECAKAEPVAVVSSVLSGGHVLDYKYDAVNRIPVGTKLCAAPQVSQPIDERAEFEKSLKLDGVSIKNSTARNIDGDYYSLPVQYAWEGWQAARKLSAPQQQPFSLLKSSPVSYSANASDAPQVAPVVPDELKVKPSSASCEAPSETYAYATGWNDCRAAMLKGAK